MSPRIWTKLFLAAAVAFCGISTATAGCWPFDVNTPYIPFCHSGNAGGGDYYLGGRLHGCGNCQCKPRRRTYAQQPQPVQEQMPTQVYMPMPPAPTPR